MGDDKYQYTVKALSLLTLFIDHYKLNDEY